MNYKVYSIRALTNMHVGGGDADFGVVDNLVQRDPVSGYPSIYSSSLKGALREYCNGESFVGTIFGGPNPGTYRFFSANLFAIPVRSNAKPFFMATTPTILKEFLNTLKLFGIGQNGFEDLKNMSEIQPIKDKALINENMAIRIEDWNSEQNVAIPDELTSIGNNITLLHEDNFKELTAQLPVIARNNLENGKSTNLWYEEIVPRETLFYFILGYGDEYQNDFESKIVNGLVQIGANASVGYGFSKITRIGG